MTRFLLGFTIGGLITLGACVGLALMDKDAWKDEQYD